MDFIPVRPPFLEASTCTTTLVLATNRVRILFRTACAHLAYHLPVPAVARSLVQLALGSIHTGERPGDCTSVDVGNTKPLSERHSCPFNSKDCCGCSRYLCWGCLAILVVVAHAIHQMDFIPVRPPFLEASTCTTTLVLATNRVRILFRTACAHLAYHLPVPAVARSLVQLALGSIHTGERPGDCTSVDVGNTKPLSE